MLQTAVPELRGHSTLTAARLYAGNVSASGPLLPFLLCGTGSCIHGQRVSGFRGHLPCITGSHSGPSGGEEGGPEAHGQTPA